MDLGQGIAQAGQGIASGIASLLEEQRKRDQLNDELMRVALQTGRATREDFAKYRDMSPKQKKDFVFNLAANFADDYKKEAELKRRQLLAAANYDTARAAEALASSQPGPGGEPSLKKLMNPYTGKPTDWAMAVDPVSKQRQVVYVGEGGYDVDPTTGAPIFRGKSGPRPVTIEEQGAMRMAEAMAKAKAEAKPTPTPKQSAETAAESGGHVRVKTIEEAKALPPGTFFYDPNGVLRRR